MPNNSTERGRRASKGVLGRLIRTVFQFYPVLLPITLVCILINAIVSSMPSVFMQNAIAVVEETFRAGDWSSGTHFSPVGHSDNTVCDQLDSRNLLYAADGHYYPGNPGKNA